MSADWNFDVERSQRPPRFLPPKVKNAFNVKSLAPELPQVHSQTTLVFTGRGLTLVSDVANSFQVTNEWYFVPLGGFPGRGYVRSIMYTAAAGSPANLKLRFVWLTQTLAAGGVGLQPDGRFQDMIGGPNGKQYAGLFTVLAFGAPIFVPLNFVVPSENFFLGILGYSQGGNTVQLTAHAEVVELAGG
jgi:hypothetical protein